MNKEIQQAKQSLKNNGYFIDNLWHIDDVKDGANSEEEYFDCSDNLAYQILSDAIEQDYINESIFFKIRSIISIEKLKGLEIMESNRLIAEFMRIDQVDIDTYQETNYNLKYHTSWDWLMPVAKKIVREVELDIEYENEYREHLMNVVPFANIEDVHEAVVEFIKNQNT